MPEYLKRHIAVSPEEREHLEKAKEQYNQTIGKSDWGGFLTTVAAAGLGALGVYGLAKLVQRSANSLKVICPECDIEFTVALPVGARGTTTVIEFECPECGCPLVLDTRSDYVK